MKIISRKAKLPSVCIILILFILGGCFSVGNSTSNTEDDSKSQANSGGTDDGTRDENDEVVDDEVEQVVDDELEQVVEDEVEQVVEEESELNSLTYNQKAEYLILYTNCISCHRNERGIDFTTVDASIVDVETAFVDSNIDESNHEAVAVDDAIDDLVDLYNFEGGGKPFSRTGLDAVGINMSDKSGINHTDLQKEKIDLLEAWIIQEYSL